MRTVEVTKFGDPDVLQIRLAADPQPGPGEVLIAVEVVEVIFLDTQLRTGWGQVFFPMRPPWVPGTGVAGTIRAVGEGVDTARVGATVIARTGNEGAYAEFVVVESSQATDVPAGLSLPVATAALHDGPLALDRLERAALQPGSRVLVTAAAGSLGQWFVPLAKAAGGYVVGAAGGPEKVQSVKHLGADLAIDYLDDHWAQAAGGPFDVVFDGVGGRLGSEALHLTADYGTFFDHGAASGSFASAGSHANEGQGITRVGVGVQFDDPTWQRLTKHSLQLLAAGSVRPVIGQQLPLERAAEAHQAMADRKVIGKTVLTIQPKTP